MVFVISDESVNSYGFKILNRGLRIERFSKNPICLWNHDRSLLPIGKWKNLGLVDGKWQAELELDETNELENRIKAKVENGVINTASIGVVVKDFDIVNERRVVLEAELLEISLTDIPSNGNAVKLYHQDNQEGGLVELSVKDVGNLFSNHKNSLEMNEEEKKLLNDLKELSESQAKQILELTNKVQALNGAGQKSEEASQKSEEASQKLEEASQKSEEEVGELVALRKELQELKRGQQVKIEDLVKGLSALNQQGQEADKRSDWSFEDWQKKDSKGLALMRKQEPERYRELLKTL